MADVHAKAAAEAAMAVQRGYDHQGEPRAGAILPGPVLVLPKNAPVLKYDAGKAPVWRGVLSYFPRALQAIARVSEYGATKYSWGAWAKIETPDREDRYADALARHFTEMGKDGMYSADPETTHLHLAHLAWNALALLELYGREGDYQKKVS